MTAPGPDVYRTMNYEVAETIAPSWERRRAEIEEVSAPVREWMVRELAPMAGQTVLELAAGAGDTGFEVAAALGERGRLISTDFSPTMLEAARRRGDELGVANVDYRLTLAARSVAAQMRPTCCIPVVLGPSLREPRPSDERSSR